MKRRLLDRLLLSARIAAVEQRAPRLRLITLAGPSLAGLAPTSGRHVRVQVSAAPGAVDWLVGTLRTYSVWSHDGETLSLMVFDHGDGPGAEWARTARPGDEVLLLKPQDTFTAAPAAYHLFAGEETAQAAFDPMLRALPRETKVFARLEVDDPGDRLHPERQPGSHLDLRWTYRRGRSASTSTTLVDAVREADLPPEPGIAYLAGEARTIQLIRRHLVEERHWPRRNVRTKPFWTPGRKGLD